jgi:hypothetical protein
MADELEGLPLIEDDAVTPETAEVAADEHVPGVPHIDDADAPKQLRDALKKSQAEVQRLRADAHAKAYADLGLDPERGIGKAAAQTFDGEPDELAAYVEAEYDYAGIPGHPQAEAIAAETARLDDASVGAGSVPVAPTTQQELAKAEAQRDNEKTMAIKGEQVSAWFR